MKKKEIRKESGEKEVNVREWSKWRQKKCWGKVRVKERVIKEKKR